MGCLKHLDPRRYKHLDTLSDHSRATFSGFKDYSPPKINRVQADRMGGTADRNTYARSNMNSQERVMASRDGSHFDKSQMSDETKIAHEFRRKSVMTSKPGVDVSKLENEQEKETQPSKAADSKTNKTSKKQSKVSKRTSNFSKGDKTPKGTNKDKSQDFL